MLNIFKDLRLIIRARLYLANDRARYMEKEIARIEARLSSHDPKKSYNPWLADAGTKSYFMHVRTNSLEEAARLEKILLNKRISRSSTGNAIEVNSHVTE